MTETALNTNTEPTSEQNGADIAATISEKPEAAPAADKPLVPTPAQLSAQLPLDAVLVTEISQSVKRQEKILRKTLLHSRIRTALLVIMVGVMIYAGFMAIGVISNINTLTDQATQTIVKLDETVSSLHLTDTMAGIDQMVEEGTGLIAEGSALIADSSETLATVLVEADEALKGISAIDFEALNTSIQKLAQITTAFGKVFGLK